MSTDRYVSPLSERYASKEMQYIFSPDMKFRTWRKLWIALAETERELGLNITQEQIDELKAHAEEINYEVAIARETRDILCADLSQNHTARELAERFQVAETSLKNYFRGVFGENLSTFLREARMRRAAELLQSSELRVAEIAAQVGYENQSKFAAVFVRRFGCPPLEYRRRARLSFPNGG